MPAMEENEWEACYLARGHAPELESDLQRQLGFVPPYAPYYYDCPWVPRTAIEVRYLNGNLLHIGQELYEKLNLVVSQDNSCRFCFAAYRLLLRITGIPEDRIRRLEQDLLSADLEPRERAALAFARKLSHSNPLPSPEDLERLRDVGFGEDAIKEMAFVAAYMVGVNQLATLAAVPVEYWERLPDSLFVRVLRPLLALRWRSRWRKGTPDFLEPELRTGPFAYLVNAFDGLPVARAMRHVIDEAWSSPLLTRRAKSLIFAVVARGLGSGRAGNEAARLALDEGLDGEMLEDVLAHLGSPVLAKVESEAVPFARETIWYQPAPIQRRARKLCEKLESPQFLELLGISALANTLCRLDAIIQETA